ncbi:MAG: aldehyde dehydrogenase, partial [Gammaproteobacteria bacterium]|nr:aldehyde dehydrogenase [Gammaproteobacteria bacterium]
CTEGGRTVSYIGEADALGAVLPSNSPGVHSLWIPSVALKVPVVLKPGSQEPWTPLRIANALLAAG